MTSVHDLQALILRLLFSTPSPIQGSKKRFGVKLPKNHAWSLAKETAAGSMFVLPYEEGEADESSPGTKEIGEVFGGKQLYKEKGSNETHWWY